MGGRLIVQVSQATYCDAPWQHLEFEEFLQPECAEYLSENWPETGFEWLRHSDIAKADGTSLRKVQPVEIKFPLIAMKLKAPSVTAAMCARLGVTKSPLYPLALLVEDLPGYRIRRHTDCAGKVISAQVYLADPGADEALGVCLESKQIPYRFNHGYAFKVTGGSWHRVNRATATRRSLQLIYYDTPTPKL